MAVGSTSLRLLESAAAADGTIRPFAGETAIFITPGYRFRAVDVMLTNFHLPRSTLFMLVAAFSGLDTMQAAYAHAHRGGLSLLFLRRRLPSVPRHNLNLHSRKIRAADNAAVIARLQTCRRLRGHGQTRWKESIR